MVICGRWVGWTQITSSRLNSWNRETFGQTERFDSNLVRKCCVSSYTSTRLTAELQGSKVFKKQTAFPNILGGFLLLFVVIPSRISQT